MITLPKVFQRLFDADYEQGMRQYQQASLARTDLIENETEYRIRVDVPGFEKNQLDIDVTNDNTISVSGKRAQDQSTV